MQVTRFSFNDKPIRVVEDENTDLWFIAKDVTDILGHRSANDGTKLLDDDEKLVRTLFVSGQNREVTLINESGLYSLVLRSNKPEAKRFKKWVTSEVLPTIRKHGAYMTEKKTEELLSNPDLIIELATTLKLERQKREELEAKAQLQERVIKESAPKLDYYNDVLSSEDAFGINIIAKELGFSGVTLNRRLHQMKVIYKQGDSWVLYHQYQDKGYTKTKTYSYVGPDGKMKSSIQTVWTQKGREFIHRLIKSDT